MFVIVPFMTVVIGACSCSKKIASSYLISRFDSDLVEEDGYFVKHYELGERQFTFHPDTLSKTGNLIKIKGTIIDDVSQDIVPYPCLYLLLLDGSRYRIIKELCTGDISGNIDCCFEWDSQKSNLLIAIKAIGYCGGIYSIEPQAYCIKTGKLNGIGQVQSCKLECK